MNRRGFLGAILAAGTAPGIISSGVLMPVRSIILPEVETGFFTLEMIQREALMLLRRNLIFAEHLQYRATPLNNGSSRIIFRRY